jgi:hypothetical protein
MIAWDVTVTGIVGIAGIVGTITATRMTTRNQTVNQLIRIHAENERIQNADKKQAFLGFIRAASTVIKAAIWYRQVCELEVRFSEKNDSALEEVNAARFEMLSSILRMELTSSPQVMCAAAGLARRLFDDRFLFSYADAFNRDQGMADLGFAGLLSAMKSDLGFGNEINPAEHQLFAG